MEIQIPDSSLVVLIGASGSGKSTFARKHFRPTEILSSDACRALVRDDENDQAATGDAFEVLRFILAKRLAAGRLTVIDATNVEAEHRRDLLGLAREHDCLASAIVLDLPERDCRERNRGRRDFGEHVVRNQRSLLRRSLRGLEREGFRHVWVLESAEEVDQAVVRRTRLWNDLREEPGPFDVIGDVHGCCDELESLLSELGYVAASGDGGDPLWPGSVWSHPGGRKAVFLGDLVDRGPRILDTVRLVRNMVAAGAALCLPGNHDTKLLRKLRGKDVRITHGLDRTLGEIDALPEAVREPFCRELARFIDSRVGHYVLDGGRLVVAHAGMPERYQGRASGRVREFALYGETTGETDEYGLPVRVNWALEYRGRAVVAYGHTPVPEAEWLNGTINIDTGCVFGGRLTALRYPEREVVSVPALQTYCEPAKPFLEDGAAAPALSAQQAHDDVLDVADVVSKRRVSTRLRATVTIREANAVAALEVMSRFAADPRWLIYLPPTMSPAETSREPGFLEHPAEAFVHFRSAGIPRAICEEKHMGSRAVAIVCRDPEAARRRFGIPGGERGIVYTRTGRRFFPDRRTEDDVLRRLGDALGRAGLWEELATDWACLDCEVMPWSAKAQELLRIQYAAVGAAGRVSLLEAVAALERLASRPGLAPATPAAEGASSAVADASEVLGRYRLRQTQVGQFVEAYRRYCWPVRSVEDLRIAPFHLMASEGKVHVERDHEWHLGTLRRVCEGDGILLETRSKVVDVMDPSSIDEGTSWWLELTERGGEGMVVKPLSFVARGPRGLAQPAVKCRGREYLRIIYGPEYSTEENLERLRARSLAAKRSLALREFALGVEALERFVRREPLRRVHECVFGVLALESEPVDPRL